MVTVGLTVSEKHLGQTNKQTNKQTNPRTNRQERKDYSRRATITNRQTNQWRQSPYSRRATITNIQTDRQTNGDNHPIVAVRL